MSASLVTDQLRCLCQYCTSGSGADWCVASLVTDLAFALVHGRSLAVYKDGGYGPLAQSTEGEARNSALAPFIGQEPRAQTESPMLQILFLWLETYLVQISEYSVCSCQCTTADDILTSAICPWILSVFR